VKINFINNAITCLIKNGRYDPLIGKDKSYIISREMSYFIKHDKSESSIVELIDCDSESEEEITQHINNNIEWCSNIKTGESSTLTEIMVFSGLPNQSILRAVEIIYWNSKNSGKNVQFMIVSLNTEEIIKYGSGVQIDLIEPLLVNCFINSKLGSTKLQNIDDILKERNSGFELTMVTKHAYATYTLLSINVLVWIIGLTGLYEFFILRGAQFSPYVIKGEVWRLITPMFIHASWDHLIGNMLSLLVIGLVIEHTYGTKKFLLIYFLGGLLGNLASFAFNDVPSIGASGAIMAAGGALIYIWVRIPNAFRNSRKNFIMLIVLNLYSFYNGFLSENIDNSAHFGGILGGFIVSCIVSLDCEVLDSHKHRRQMSTGIYAAIVLILVLTGVFRLM
jgi:rhomboid protease GluP